MKEILPFLLLLVCPLMMVFMMKGMNHGGHDKHRDSGKAEDQAALTSADADELHALHAQLTEQLGLLDSRLEELERTQVDHGQDGRPARRVRVGA